MWQYLVVGLAVAGALFFVARQVRRNLDPKSSPGCGCGCSAGDCGQAKGTGDKGRRPQDLDSLAVEACPACAGAGKRQG